MGAKEQVLERFESLSPRLKLAARFVVDHPNEVVIESMRTLAEHAGVQPATLVRLAQQLGYTGWPELKTAFARDLGLNVEGYGERAKHLATRAGDGQLLSEMFNVQKHNLTVTEALCAETLREAVHLLKSARSVFVAGFRASFPIAYSLVYGYSLFRNSVHLLDGLSGGLEMQLRPVTEQDVVVVISFAPYSSECLSVIRAAKAANARLLAFTDSNASPLALAADVSVLFSVSSPSFFPSVAAAVAVTEALLELIVADGGADVAARIDLTEHALVESGAYIQRPVKRQRKQG